MRHSKLHSFHEPTLPGNNDPVAGSFFVAPGRMALVIRDGIPEQFYRSGQHALSLGPGRVEVRLLASSTPISVPPDSGSLALPYERSYLHVDGVLIGMVKPHHGEAGDGGSAIQTWEGSARRILGEPYLETLRACLTEPLRACLPSSGACCGGRMHSMAAASVG